MEKRTLGGWLNRGARSEEQPYCNVNHDVRIYDKALSLEGIQELYKQVSP